MIPEEQKRTIRRYATMATPRPWRNVCGVWGCNLFADDPHVEVARFNTTETPDGYRTASHNANLAAHAVNVIIPLLDENDRLTAANAALTREVEGLTRALNAMVECHNAEEEFRWEGSPEAAQRARQARVERDAALAAIPPATPAPDGRRDTETET